MASVTQSAGVPEGKTNYAFIGRAWVNTAKSGKQFIRLQIDRRLNGVVTLNPDDSVLLFTNKKREGKADADYRAAIVIK